MTSEGDQTSMSHELTMQLTKELVENADLRNSIKDMVIAEMGSMADIGSAKKVGRQRRRSRGSTICWLQRRRKRQKLSKH